MPYNLFFLYNATIMECSDVVLLQGSVPNKFYVHNDMFRYEDEVFGDSEPELDEGEATFKIEGFVKYFVC